MLFVHPAQAICVAIFFMAGIACVLTEELMRSEVVDQLNGVQQISWSDFRSVTDWFGEGGLWRLHQQYYPSSRMRFCFAASWATVLVAFIVGSILQAYGIR